jgi:hypothetical protein
MSAMISTIGQRYQAGDDSAPHDYSGTPPVPLRNAAKWFYCCGGSHWHSHEGRLALHDNRPHQPWWTQW